MTTFTETFPGHPPRLLVRLPSNARSCSINPWSLPGIWLAPRQLPARTTLQALQDHPFLKLRFTTNTLPDQTIGSLVIDEAPREPQQPRKRDPPDFQDVVTQQTMILAGMLAELRAKQAKLTAPAANQAEPTAGPNFNWSRLVLPTETNFQVPGDG